MSISVVWFKRDLRLQDHAPLAEAIRAGRPVLLCYCFEPELMQEVVYTGETREGIEAFLEKRPPKY